MVICNTCQAFGRRYFQTTLLQRPLQLRVVEAYANTLLDALSDSRTSGVDTIRMNMFIFFECLDSSRADLLSVQRSTLLWLEVFRLSHLAAFSRAVHSASMEEQRGPAAKLMDWSIWGASGGPVVMATPAPPSPVPSFAEPPMYITRSWGPRDRIVLMARPRFFVASMSARGPS